jgi:hypothetical protein
MLEVICLLIGILLWPELTFCIYLCMTGHWFLGIVAFMTTFGSAKSMVVEKVKGS